MSARRVLAAAAAALAVCGCAFARLPVGGARAPVRAHSVSTEAAPDWTPIRVAADAVPLAPSDPSRRAVGPLRYRGGLELQSADPNFGGLSGLAVGADGKLVAVSDQGFWFAAKLVFNDAGDLIGLVDARLAAMRGEDGQPFASKFAGDSEDVARLPDGRLAVSFERDHRVAVYDLDRKGPAAAPDLTIRPADTEKLRPNQSFEGVAPFGSDRLLIASERGTNGGTPRFWISSLDPAVHAPSAGKAAVEPQFGISGLARLGDGDYLELQRFYAPLIGARIVLAKVSGDDLAASPPRWRAETIAELAPPVGLDNFEGVAVVPSVAGPSRIYLISDNNFSGGQRTLLYAFDLD